jgi:hypothetical protein
MRDVSGDTTYIETQMMDNDGEIRDTINFETGDCYESSHGPIKCSECSSRDVKFVCFNTMVRLMSEHTDKADVWYKDILDKKYRKSKNTILALFATEII